MFSLRPSIRACANHGAVVFLDLSRDRYFAVELSGAPEIAGVGGCGDGSAASSLLARGLIEPCVGSFAPNARAPTVLRDELDPFSYRRAVVTFLDWAQMHCACVRADYALRRRRLDLTFAALERRVAAIARTATSTADAVAKFELMRPWYPRRRICLFDSLALMNFLIAMGCASCLVMGVRAKPFAAHCWVEADGVCLNDAAETCRSYTQIAWAG